jgi:hypothetical protein
MAVVEHGYAFQDRIKKASGIDVATGLFDREEYSGLSGLLCSRVDAVNRPHDFGADFQLAPNPNAKVPLPPDFRLRGEYFAVVQHGDGRVIAPQKFEAPYIPF